MCNKNRFVQDQHKQCHSRTNKQELGAMNQFLNSYLVSFARPFDIGPFISTMRHDVSISPSSLRTECYKNVIFFIPIIQLSTANTSIQSKISFLLPPTPSSCKK